MDILILAGALVIILVGAEFFTNGIEWFGRKLNLAEGAVGSVLAAIGTALPETMIPVIAILFSSSTSSHEVGVGAILGAPFMLSTLAMFVTGLAVVWAARSRTTGDAMQIDTVVLGHDVRYFAVAYALAIAAAFLPLEPVWLKWIAALVLLGIYAWYVKGHFESDPDVDAADLAPLRFHPLDRRAHRRDPGVPRLRIVNAQVLAAVGLILVGAIFFVDAVEHLATELGLDSTLLALVIAPIATELPEALNSSVIWARRGKDVLALGNITGAMVFQATFPVAVGLLFTPWHLDLAAGVAAGIALLAALILLVTVRIRGGLNAKLLLLQGALYVAYVIFVFTRA